MYRLTRKNIVTINNNQIELLINLLIHMNKCIKECLKLSKEKVKLFKS